MFESVNSFPLLACVITATAVILTLITFRLFSTKQVSDLGEKHVLITGCDSGFGHETAIRLDKMGVCVLATCLTKEGEEGLKSVASDRLKTFQLDVTNSQQIKDLYEQVKRQLPSGYGRWDTRSVFKNVGTHCVQRNVLGLHVDTICVEWQTFFPFCLVLTLIALFSFA